MPFLALLGLAHLRIASFFGVLCGRRRVDDACVHDGSAVHDTAAMLQPCLNTVSGFERL